MKRSMVISASLIVAGFFAGVPAAQAIDYCIRTCNSEVPCSTECVPETEPWFIITCGQYGDCGGGSLASSATDFDLLTSSGTECNGVALAPQPATAAVRPGNPQGREPIPSGGR
jgi:hypothetical protein